MLGMCWWHKGSWSRRCIACSDGRCICLSRLDLADSASTRHLLNLSVRNFTVGRKWNLGVKAAAFMLSIGPLTSAISSVLAIMNSLSGLKPLWTPCSRTLLVLYLLVLTKPPTVLSISEATLGYTQAGLLFLLNFSELVHWYKKSCTHRKIGQSIMPSTLGLAKVYCIYLYWPLINCYVLRN